MKTVLKKGFCLLCFALIVSAAFFGVSTVFKSGPASSYNANSDSKVYSQKQTPIFEGITISQEGYVFGLEDMEIVNNNFGTTYNLYVNTAITINKTSDTYALRITEIKDSGDDIGSANTTHLNNKNDYKVIEYNAKIENRLRIQLAFINNEGYQIVSEFQFNLIQTPNHFAVNPIYSWTDFSGANITAPTIANTYSNYITLNNLTATKHCPIYVDFYFNGEFYSIYTDNADGIFYNTLTGGRLTNKDTLKFSEAGRYQLFIYDKTAYRLLKNIDLWNTNYKIFDREAKIQGWVNAATYSFDIATYVNPNDYEGGSNNPEYLKALAGNIYIVAEDEVGSTIVSTQTVNRTVKIKFYNLDPRVVGTVVVSKRHLTIEGSNVQEDEILTNDYTIAQINNTTFTYSDDNSYAIYIYDREGLQIGTSSSEGESNFSFTILKDIHGYYKNLNNNNLQLVPENNKIYTINQSELLDTNFLGFSETDSTGKVIYLKSSTTTQYNVMLARASTAIDGINSGDKISGEANLTVHGVGDILVTVTRDGYTTTYNLKDGDTIPNTSKVGSYTIRIQDQMGFSASKTFKISKKFDTATIVLIIVGALIIVLAVVFIVRLRTKVKVR